MSSWRLGAAEAGGGHCRDGTREEEEEEEKEEEQSGGERKGDVEGREEDEEDEDIGGGQGVCVGWAPRKSVKREARANTLKSGPRTPPEGPSDAVFHPGSVSDGPGA